METIYEIYIGDTHWETAITRTGLALLWHEAQHIGKIRKEEVKYREVKTTCQEIADMQMRKYRVAEERWAREDLQLNK